MIIKKLELQGFKSFPEKTKILFHPGITAVIGPNGTGKSNIVDALLWVLGGKRFKTQRGERSSDIIFNGNENEPPLSMTDVNLHLGDDEEELIINHRLFRSGESEYRLDGKLARLKDIQESLWKRAIGEKEYFVIEQGSIGLFLSSKPTEKRQLMEEAAGTAYYKDKKRQAENKLESSEQNLTRLEDIINEVLKAKNSLKRQAQAAVKYRRLRENIRKLTSLHYRKKIEELEKSQKEAALHYKKFLNKENESISRIKDEEKLLAIKRKEGWALEKEVKEEQKNIFAVKSNLSRLTADKEQNTKRIDFLEEKKGNTKESIREIDQESSLLEKESIEASENLRKSNRILTQKQKALKEATQAIQKFKEKNALQQKSIESLKNEYFQKLSTSTEIKNERIKIEKELELILRQEEKLVSQLEKEQSLLCTKEKEIKQRMEETIRTQKQKEANKKELDRCQKEIEEVSSLLHILQNKMTGLYEKKEKEKQHLQILQKIEEQERSIDVTKDLPESIGFLADQIEIDPEYMPLIDVFWEEEAKAILLQAQDFLKYLGHRKLKGNFLLLHPQKEETFSFKMHHDARVLGRLKSYVRANPKIKDFISRLKEAAIVEDIKKAVELWLQFPTLNYITLQGDLLLSSGLIKLGTKKEGFFALVQEIKRLKEKIVLIDKKIHPLNLNIKEEIKKKQKIEKNIKQISEYAAHLEKAIEEKEKETAFDRLEKQKLELTISTLKNELKILSDDRRLMKKKLYSISLKIERIVEEEQALRKELDSGEKEFESHQKKSEEKKRFFFELKSSIELFQEKIKNINSQIQSLKRRKQTLREKIFSFHREIQNAEEIKSQLRENIKQISKKIKALEEEKKLKETQSVQNEIHLRRIQKELKEMENRIENQREEYEEIKEERVKWEIKKAEKHRDLANLEESCWQELKKSIQEIKKEISEETLKDIVIQQKLEEAKEKLQKFKAVNLMAEEEYISQKKRYDFLLQQKKDLRESIDSTKEAIRKIDQESKAQFLNALVEINKNFQKVFAILFNGGMAELKLTDENNLMESGVDIVAQPPGKKIQSLSLLSGGEQSLTSLAFFFALFRYKPTPFCILDEVDAALDDLNLERFLNLMKKIKDQTQFILITHNFKTMEVADYIYGTTMAEPNITNIYSVKLEKNK